MMLQGCRKADRAEVVERDRFATPNSLKSHRQRNLLSPVSNTCARTPKLCMPSRPIHPSKNYYAALKSRTAANLHSPAAPPVPHFPRFRALALFGRRPPQRVDSLVMPASENLHNNGLMQAQETANPRPAAVGLGTEFGLLGDIIDWITDRARRPTRVLALGQETDFCGSQLFIHKLPTTITAATITDATIAAAT